MLIRSYSLTRRQTEALDAGESEALDSLVALAQQQATDHGEPCQVLSNTGTLLHTCEPSPLCRSCHEHPAALDSADPRYCWPCLREFADSYSLNRVAPFAD